MTAYLANLLHKTFYFYPIQIVFFQVRRHPLLMSGWLILFLVAYQAIGTSLGIPYLFYTPEWQSHPTFSSTLIWGVAYGSFVLAYHMTTYILDGHHANFFLQEKAPFLQYSLNNSLLPVVFFFSFLHHYLNLHLKEPNLWLQLAGIIGGTFGFTTLMVVYFAYTGQDLFKLRRRGLLPYRAIMRRIYHAETLPKKTFYYLSFPHGLRSSHNPLDLNPKILYLILAQNHRNALFLHFLLLLGIVGLGIGHYVWGIYLPASAVFLGLLTLLYMLWGAVEYWIKQAGMWGMGILALALGFFFSTGWLKGVSYAPGLFYARPPTPYTLTSLEAHLHPDTLRKDSLLWIRILSRWKSHQPSPKPPLLVIGTSGGGWRSALWTLVNLQLLDSLSGNLEKTTFLLTGASGGMIGAAFWRELKLFYPERSALQSRNQMSHDAINRIAFSGLIGLVTPSFAAQYDPLTQERYPKGRGYSFESQLLQNLHCFHNRRLRDYAAVESLAQAPITLLTPAIINDGRQLLISSLPASFLCKVQSHIVAAELQRLMPASYLHYTTALRMNASFPLVMPTVLLPTAPPIEVIDAGAIDNFGQSIIHRFLYTFRPWIEKNCSRVIILQLRDLPPLTPISDTYQLNLLQRWAKLAGGLYETFSYGKMILAHTSFAFLQRSYRIPIYYEELPFHPSLQTPPLNFHLSLADKETLVKTAYSEENLWHLKKIVSLLR
ncbi:MAG: hypothetical protein ACUVRD_07455 [Bacteroidia bacterium]